MKIDIIKIFATFFGIGYLPYFPGTWASLAGLGIYFLLRSNTLIYLIFTLAILVIGFLVCSRAEEKFGIKDASLIVIDEVSAVLILLYFIPQDLFSLLSGFFIFRIMDILKPFPIKKIEKFSGSWGIMFDDLIADLYTFLFILIVNNCFRR